MGIRRILCAAFMLMCLPVYLKAQSVVAEKDITWHNIMNRAVSDDGRWVYFTKIYDDTKSEGVLHDTKTTKNRTTGAGGKFYLDNSYFIVLNANRGLHFIDLKRNTEKIFNEVSGFEYDAQTETLLLQEASGVRWINLKSDRERRFPSITKMENIKGTSYTFLSNESETLLLNRSTGTHVSVLKKSGKLLASVADPQTRHIKLVSQDEAGYWIHSMDYSGKAVSPPKKMTFGTAPKDLVFLSQNTLMEKNPLVKAGSGAGDTVEVWSSTDRALKPKLMRMRNAAETATLHDLSVRNAPPQTYRNFTTEHYLVFDDAYLLEVSELENYDFKINDIAPRPKIILRNRNNREVEMEVQEVQTVYPSSANMNYIVYFKSRDWYLYDVATRRTVNITAPLTAEFYRLDRLNTTVQYPADMPRFSPDYRYIYLTSERDIWKYDVRTGLSEKLTDYSDKKIAFRIVEPLEGANVLRMKWNNNPVLMNDYLVLLMMNKETQIHHGLAVWKEKKLRIISPPAPQLIDKIRKSHGLVSYVIQNANTPPKLMVYELGNSKEKTVHDSGKGLYTAAYPKTEMREWTNPKNERTYTTVVLPPGYSPEKKYPVIMRIYENEARRFREFEFPTYRNPTGFNRILSAMEGYIVILPRITFSKNKVGSSAVQAVEETVKKMQSWYSLDPDNIGIIGHSFGGYETNYIVTQSSMFKTAVSGSGIADIVSDYLTVHKMYQNSNISRYTNEQFGFSDGFYKLKKEYLENSPVLMADQIKTPLLLWSGKNDEHVEWRQSVEMFVALASLKKEVRLLLFPDDPHVLVKPKNQTEATQKILQWFDYYLKNGRKPEWF